MAVGLMQHLLHYKNLVSLLFIVNLWLISGTGVRVHSAFLLVISWISVLSVVYRLQLRRLLEQWNLTLA